MLNNEHRAHDLALEILRIQCQADAVQQNYSESGSPLEEICKDAISVYQANFKACMEAL